MRRNSWLDLVRGGNATHNAVVAVGIRDRPITPRSPWQNGHVKRLIGSDRLDPSRPCRGFGGKPPSPPAGE